MPKPKSKPVKSITEEIAELRAMPVSELVDRYETVFGKPPRVKHKDWLPAIVSPDATLEDTPLPGREPSLSVERRYATY